ncbi:MAG: hypothetical protein FJX00_02950 [Alphaproteobacteria bacterium]|nr:hypothetical protein [Alphaproteobacteria bacterium]
MAKKPLPDLYVVFNRKPNKEGEDFLKTMGATKQLEYGLDRDDTCLFKDAIKKKHTGNMWEISPEDFRRLP